MSNDDMDLLDISQNEKALASFKEEFFKENLQPDSVTKVFSDNVKIDIKDIYYLNEIVIEKLKKYENAGLIVQVYVKFSNKKSILFSSWSEFEEYKWLESNSISRIVISWKFNVKFPNYSTPQKHTMMVKLSNNMRPEEIIKLMLSGELDDTVDDMEKNFFPIYTKVNFINRSLGDELLDSVGEWVNGLEENELKENKFIAKLRKFKRPVSHFTDIITFSTFLYLTFSIYFYLLENLNINLVTDTTYPQFKSMIIYTFLVIGSIYIIQRVSKLIGNSLFKSLSTYGKTYIFSITRGDKNKRKKLIKDNKYDLMNIGIKFFGSLFIGVLASIISTIIIN